MSQRDTSTVANSIRKAVCRNYYSGDGDCPVCHHQSACELLVDDALGLVSNLANKRKPDSAKNDS